MAFRTGAEVKTTLANPERVRTRKLALTQCQFCDEEPLAWHTTSTGKAWLYNVARAVDLDEAQQHELRALPNFQDDKHGLIYILKFEPHRCPEEILQARAEQRAAEQMELDEAPDTNGTDSDQDSELSNEYTVVEEEVMQLMTEDQVRAQQNSTAAPPKRKRGQKN